jgi:endonuclease/exonuclease/phosphatase family metal-dependent hydrolase
VRPRLKEVLLALFALIIATSTRAPASTPTRADEMCIDIATLNLWHSSKNLQLREDRFKKALKHRKPSLFAVQEAATTSPKGNGLEPRVLSRMYRHRFFHGTNRWPWMKEGLALHSQFPILEQGSVRLPHDRWGSKRRAIWARIRVGTARLLVVNTHLSPFRVRRFERRAQIAALVSVIQKLAHPTESVVLLGDFNDTLESGVLDPILNDGFEEVLPSGDSTYCQSNPWVTTSEGKIDHIFVKASRDAHAPRPSVADAEIWLKDTPVSDHYGVKARLCF